MKITRVEGGKTANLFNYLLKTHHYLSYCTPVGENMKYVIQSATGRPLACMLFGAAAWKVEPRDKLIGWDPIIRSQNLNFIANQSRFLILPWIRVQHLASHLQSRISKRINSDWEENLDRRVKLTNRLRNT